MINPQQCRAARAWINWSQEDLAKAARVALSTIRDFEREEREPIAHNVEAIERALEAGGIQFTSGAGERAGLRFDGGKVSERDTYYHILDMLDDMPSGFMRTADIIVGLEQRLPLGINDLMILDGRSDTRFSQIVRNVVSHRDSPKNLIGMGYAEYDKVKRGLRITPEGRAVLLNAQKLGKTVL